MFDIENSFAEDSRFDSPGPGAAAFRGPDIDAFEGARKVTGKEMSEIEEESIPLYGGISTANASSSGSVRRHNKASEKQKQNISLLSGGPSLAGYRDRVSPIGKLSPSERTKLPAPPMGHTTGHGLLPAGSPTKGMGLGSYSNSITSKSIKTNPLGTTPR
jgi:hypothetical protein